MQQSDFRPELLAYGFHFIASVVACVLAALGVYFEWFASDLSETGAAGAFGFLAVPLVLAFFGAAGLGIFFTLFDLRRWPLVLLASLIVVPSLSMALLPSFSVVLVLMAFYPVLGIAFFVRHLRSGRGNV